MGKNCHRRELFAKVPLGRYIGRTNQSQKGTPLQVEGIGRFANAKTLECDGALKPEMELVRKEGLIEELSRPEYGRKRPRARRESIFRSRYAKGTLASGGKTQNEGVRLAKTIFTWQEKGFQSSGSTQSSSPGVGEIRSSVLVEGMESGEFLLWVMHTWGLETGSQGRSLRWSAIYSKREIPEFASRE